MRTGHMLITWWGGINVRIDVINFILKVCK